MTYQNLMNVYYSSEYSALQNSLDESSQETYKSSQIKFNNEYVLPPITLLKTTNEKRLNFKEIEKTNTEYSKRLEIILKEYGVEGNISSFKPSVC